MTDDTADFSYSQLSRAWTHINVVSDLVFAFAFSAIASYAIGDAVAPILILGGMVMFYVSFLFLVRAYWRIRYRYVMRAQYLVEPNGIVIRSNDSKEVVGWENIAFAEYLPLLPAYRLTTHPNSQPVVLFVMSSWRPTSQINRRNVAAAKLLRAGLGYRLKTRWLPW